MRLFALALLLASPCADQPVDSLAARLVERQGWIGGYRALNLLAPDDDTVRSVLSNTDAADISQTYVGSGFSADLIRAALGPDE